MTPTQSPPPKGRKQEHSSTRREENLHHQTCKTTPKRKQRKSWRLAFRIFRGPKLRICRNFQGGPDFLETGRSVSRGFTSYRLWTRHQQTRFCPSKPCNRFLNLRFFEWGPEKLFPIRGADHQQISWWNLQPSRQETSHQIPARSKPNLTKIKGESSFRQKEFAKD